MKGAGPRFLLSGYYGFGNLGDEALLGIIVAQLRSRFADGIVEVLTQDPAQTARTYGVETTPRADFAAVGAALRRADVVLSGGGGLLQNATSTRSLVYYAEIVRRAVALRKKTMIFAQSIGPLDFAGRGIVRFWCRGVRAATVRDERSRALLASLLPDVPVERTADPVFLLDPGPKPFDLEAQGLGAKAGPLAIVSVRKSTGFEVGAAVIAAAVDRLHETYGAQVAFLPVGGASDAEAATSVIRRCRTAPALLPYCELAEAAQVIGSAHVVIGMRLHALIIAARLGVPFLAVPYDPKVSSLSQDLGYPLPPLYDPATLKRGDSPASALAAVDRLWNERDALAKLLRAAAAAMQLRAARNFDVLEGLLGS